MILHTLLLERTDNRPNARFVNGLAGYITIHNTGNRAAGADAAAHARWHHDSAPYSWHFTVDDKEVWQQLSDAEQGWHAGDDDGPGNTTSIGIEICMHTGIDQEQANANAAELVRSLLAKGHGSSGVVQHNHWTGKDCPEVIRHQPGRWERFLAQCRAEEEDMPDPRVDELWRRTGGDKGVDFDLLQLITNQNTATMAHLATHASGLSDNDKAEVAKVLRAAADQLEAD